MSSVKGQVTAMIRVVFASALLIFAGITVSGCGGAYAEPSHALSADIAATHVGDRNQTPDFRDTDLSAR
jgi:hypothetical protein